MEAVLRKSASKCTIVPIVDLTGGPVNGEAYITLPHMLIIKDGLNILNYEIPKFICLGTIRDYKIYNLW